MGGGHVRHNSCFVRRGGHGDGHTGEGRDGGDASPAEESQGLPEAPEAEKPRKDPSPGSEAVGTCRPSFQTPDPHTVIFCVAVTLPGDSDAISQIGNRYSCHIWLMICTSQEHFWVGGMLPQGSDALTLGRKEAGPEARSSWVIFKSAVSAAGKGRRACYLAKDRVGDIL